MMGIFLFKSRSMGIVINSAGQYFSGLPDKHNILLKQELIIPEGLNLRYVALGTLLPIIILGVKGASAGAVLKINT